MIEEEEERDRRTESWEKSPLHAIPISAPGDIVWWCYDEYFLDSVTAKDPYRVIPGAINVAVTGFYRNQSYLYIELTYLHMTKCMLLFSVGKTYLLGLALIACSYSI